MSDARQINHRFLKDESAICCGQLYRNQALVRLKATVTLGRGLTRCPRIEQNSQNPKSASDRLQPLVLIHALCLHTQTDEKCRTHTVEIVCERLNRV